LAELRQADQVALSEALAKAEDSAVALQELQIDANAMAQRITQLNAGA
jgi:hypothetical protein